VRVLAAAPDSRAITGWPDRELLLFAAQMKLGWPADGTTDVAKLAFAGGTVAGNDYSSVAG